MLLKYTVFYQEKYTFGDMVLAYKAYRSNIAIQIKGTDYSKIARIKAMYMDKLENDPLTFVDDMPCLMEVDTYHDKRESYIAAGKFLWGFFDFQVRRDHTVWSRVVRKAIYWKGNYDHQCETLLDIFTKYGYSWCYVHVRKGEELRYDNKELIENFDDEVNINFLV